MDILFMLLVLVALCSYSWRCARTRGAALQPHLHSGRPRHAVRVDPDTDSHEGNQTLRHGHLQSPVGGLQETTWRTQRRDGSPAGRTAERAPWLRTITSPSATADRRTNAARTTLRKPCASCGSMRITSRTLRLTTCAGLVLYLGRCPRRRG